MIQEYTPTLEPCPFCKSEAKTHIYFGDENNPGKYRVQCSKCAAMRDCFKYSLAEAVASWNTRAGMRVDALVEILKNVERELRPHIGGSDGIWFKIRQAIKRAGAE